MAKCLASLCTFPTYSAALIAHAAVLIIDSCLRQPAVFVRIVYNQPSACAGGLYRGVAKYSSGCKGPGRALVLLKTGLCLDAVQVLPFGYLPLLL